MPRGIYHHMSKTPEWRAWRDMLSRCQSETNPFYHRYGGRGIKVHPRWVESFLNFLEDVGPRPSAGFELDREDNNGDYEPGNCRWATRDQQVRNSTVAKLCEAQVSAIRELLKDKLPHRQIASMFGVSPSTITRINTGEAWSPGSSPQL